MTTVLEVVSLANTPIAIFEGHKELGYGYTPTFKDPDLLRRQVKSIRAEHNYGGAGVAIIVQLFER